MQESTLKLPHNLILEDRKKLTVSGVQDVDCFDESLVVRGRGLHVNAFDVSTGEFSMEGDISGVEYSDEAKGKSGFFARIFR